MAVIGRRDDLTHEITHAVYQRNPRFDTAKTVDFLKMRHLQVSARGSP